ncbi:MAG: glycosyltransferase, partial [Candidatus Omnitrophica bacterium]|nr:glycosyltransferase [Candidatus Omnitrophota bacterium]
GYYLIGLRKPQRFLFEGIQWSSPSVYNQTIRRAKERGIDLVSISSRQDVDDPRTLRLLKRRLQRSPDKNRAFWTRRFLKL